MTDDAEARLGTPNRRSAHYTHFSEEEMDRRQEVVRDLLDERDADALVVYGNAGFEQVNLAYLADYRPPFATYLVFFADPDEPTTLFVGVSNHVQYVREVAAVEDIEVMLPDPAAKVARRLAEGRVGGDAGRRRAGGRGDTGGDRVGIVGYGSRYDLSIPHGHYETLTRELNAEFVDLTAAYEGATSVRSEEELDRIRRAAALTDAGMDAIREAAEPGVREVDLKKAMQRRYLDEGGAEGVTFISSAPMEGAEPGEPLPWKHPSTRRLREGDVITTETSGAVAGYRSQLHRPFAVGRAPTDTYADIFAVAAETYEAMVAALRPGNTVADVYDAVAPIEESEYKIYDVLLHGYGNGYQPPFVGTRSSNYWPGEDAADPVTADWTFRENQVVVVQPNVVTKDERCGLQLGSAVVVGDSPEVLQRYPVEFGRV